MEGRVNKLCLIILNMYYFTSFGGRNKAYMLTHHDSRHHFGLSGIRTYVHPHGSPELCHCATGAYYQITLKDHLADQSSSQYRKGTTDE